ncbi:MAG: hypothetical protein QF893_11060 [Alphaproteobacteria bacterium]|jgi:hypothetical protein|nr:hypothetical protein [Alphaproteobacteria bacterium]
MLRLVWIVFAVVVAMVVVFPMSLAAYTLIFASSAYGWAGELVWALAAIVGYGLVGLLFSGILLLYPRWSKAEAAERASDETLLRVTFLLPCILFGALGLVLQFYWMATTAYVDLSMVVLTLVFFIVSNAALAAGLWFRQLGHRPQARRPE